MDNGFLQQTAQSIIDTMDWKQLSRTTLVLPSHRAGLVLKEELLRLQQQRHAQAVWAPQVLTLTQLQDALSPLYPEDEFFTIVRLYKLFRQSEIADSTRTTDIMPLDLFYGWGRQMLEDFTNIDASMPAEEVPNFFENTIAAHELEQWHLDPETEERLRALVNGGTYSLSTGSDSIRAQYETLWRKIADLYQALQSEMLAEQKGYAGMRQRAVIAQWDQEQLQAKIAGRTYIFVGFNYLLPVERELMMRLRDAGQAQFYWDYVADFETNEKAFSFARLNSGILGNAMPARTWGAPRPVTVTACVSREAQAQYVHRWLQDNYTQKGQKVGVVICDETMLESVIYALPAIVLPGETEAAPINITKGFPLRNTDIYARVLTWLNDRARGKADELVTPDFIDSLLADLFPTSTPAAEDTTTASLSWQELLILESEYQVRKIANQMRLLLTNGLDDIPFTLKLLRMLMRRAMDSCSMPFHGEPVTDVQVMGVLETRMLDFDKLLLLNVEEGVLPQKKADTSFIPFYLRKAYHMQTADERATVYAYNFFRLLSRAAHSTLLYATAETSEGGKGMSRFLMQIRYSDEFEVKNTVLQEPGVVTTTQPECSESMPSFLSTHPHRISPSAINTYIACPYSFYKQYIQKIRPQEDEQVIFASNTLGSFVHYAIEYVYRDVLHCEDGKPRRVMPDEIEAIRTDEQQLQEALMFAYGKMNEEAGEIKYILEHHAGENVMIVGYVKNILERDREDAKVGLQIYMLEKELTFPVTIDSIGTIHIGGKIDRLDIYGERNNQILRVVDYKSGGYNDKTHAERMSASWEDIMTSEAKGYVRQTLIYSHAVLKNGHPSQPIEPHLFFCRRKLTDIVTTIDVENTTVNDYRNIHDRFEETLQAKVEEILTVTEFPRCAPENCPTFCPFYDLCGRKQNDY